MTSLWRADHRPAPSTPFADGAHHEVVIVGAGLTGLFTGVLLAGLGRDVAVVEAEDVGALASGANTGKVSLLQGTRLSSIREGHPAAFTRAYVEASRDGQDLLRAFAAAAGVPLVRRTAYTYAQESAGLSSVQDEWDAATEAGLPVRWARTEELAPLTFPVVGAIALDDQLAVDPDTLLSALADAFVAAGGALHTGVRVTRTAAVPHARVETTAGTVTADRIVLATGTPIADRGLYFAKVSGMRSYAVSFEVDGPVPEGMFLSADQPSRSVRAVEAADGAVGRTRLIVGGNGHPVGRTASEEAQYDDLVAWTTTHFPGAVETFRWSAQDYRSHNEIPFIGAMPRSLGRIRFATGYAKWGLTGAPAAALRLAAEITGTARDELPSWMTVFGMRPTLPIDLARGVIENARVGMAAAKGWTGAFAQRVPVRRPADGEGVVASRGGRPVGVSTVAGRTRAVSTVCPHLGGVLEWNDAECTWDCPLHASRFRPDGTRIEGPAIHDLTLLKDSSEPR